MANLAFHNDGYFTLVSKDDDQILIEKSWLQHLYSRGLRTVITILCCSDLWQNEDFIFTEFSKDDLVWVKNVYDGNYEEIPIDIEAMRFFNCDVITEYVKETLDNNRQNYDYDDNDDSDDDYYDNDDYQSYEDECEDRYYDYLDDLSNLERNTGDYMSYSEYRERRY